MKGLKDRHSDSTAKILSGLLVEHVPWKCAFENG